MFFIGLVIQWDEAWDKEHDKVQDKAKADASLSTEAQSAKAESVGSCRLGSLRYGVTHASCVRYVNARPALAMVNFQWGGHYPPRGRPTIAASPADTTSVPARMTKARAPLWSQ